MTEHVANEEIEEHAWVDWPAGDRELGRVMLVLPHGE